jgi:hypothetical protein
MGADSEKTGGHDGWAEDGFVPCPESAHPKWPAQSASDRITASQAEAVQHLDYPDKVAPGAVPKKGGDE